MDKTQVATVRAAAGIASGASNHQLAAALWDFEAHLRAKSEPVVDVPTQLRNEYMDEQLHLAHYGLDKARTWNGYARGLHRAMELMGADVPTWDEAWARAEQQINERSGETDPFG